MWGFGEFFERINGDPVFIDLTPVSRLHPGAADVLASDSLKATSLLFNPTIYGFCLRT
jgi:hypothetical protein